MREPTDGRRPKSHASSRSQVGTRRPFPLAWLALAGYVLWLILFEFPRRPVTIYYTGNLRGRLVATRPYLNPPVPIGRRVTAAQVYRVLKQARSQARERGGDVILVDCGDSVLGPDPLSGLTAGGVVARLWKDAEMDAVALGVEDRRSGARRMELLKARDVPVLASDVDGRFVLRRIDGQCVGLAAVGDGTAAASIVKRCREAGADVCILVAAVSSLQRLEGCGADAIIPARYLWGVPANRGAELDGSCAVAPWVDGRVALGRLVVERRGLLGRRVAYSLPIPMMSRYVPVDVAIPQVAGSTAAPVVERWPGDVRTVVEETLGYCLDPIEHEESVFRESPLGTYTAELVRAAVGADVALINHRALRGGLSGPVAYADIPRVLPFPNQIVTLEVPGRLLETVFKVNAMEDPRYLQSAGARVRYVPGQPDTVEVRIGGTPLESDRLYRLATIDYVLHAHRQEALRDFKGYPTGLYLPMMLSDDLEDRRIVGPGDAVTERVGRQQAAHPPPRRLDLSALDAWDLPRARQQLTEKLATNDDVERACAAWWLGYASFLAGDGASAGKAWREASKWAPARRGAERLIEILRLPPAPSADAPNTMKAFTNRP